MDKDKLNNIINDINIIIDAINANDSNDAIQMLKDIQEDLKVFLLMC